MGSQLDFALARNDYYTGNIKRRCDGLCRQFYETEELETFSECLHTICKNCAIKGKMGAAFAYPCGNIDCFMQRKISALSDTKERANLRDTLFQPAVDYNALFQRLIAAVKREANFVNSSISQNSATKTMSSSTGKCHSPGVCSSLFAHTPKITTSACHSVASSTIGEFMDRSVDSKKNVREQRSSAIGKGCRRCNVS
ncbi:hypothetical protein DdX_10791 [Ditylenchus destructor]|uniref:Uncharacterized protein n=1 Tax=Ditylenchus destructor TaxID=166010 RepID=A0AAD4MX50_9BILA|nr:hypothetical protein DdX_10791 [Ditylenchus destructor]